MSVTERDNGTSTGVELLSLVLFATGPAYDSVPIGAMVFAVEKDQSPDDVIVEKARELLGLMGQRDIPDTRLELLVSNWTTYLGVGFISLDSGKIQMIVWQDSRLIHENPLYHPNSVPVIWMGCLCTNLWLEVRRLSRHVPVRRT